MSVNSLGIHLFLQVYRSLNKYEFWITWTRVANVQYLKLQASTPMWFSGRSRSRKTCRIKTRYWGISQACWMVHQSHPDVYPTVLNCETWQKDWGPGLLPNFPKAHTTKFRCDVSGGIYKNAWGWLKTITFFYHYITFYLAEPFIQNDVQSTANQGHNKQPNTPDKI